MSSDSESEVQVKTKKGSKKETAHAKAPKVDY
jgi:hypothetical protein